MLAYTYLLPIDLLRVLLHRVLASKVVGTTRVEARARSAGVPKTVDVFAKEHICKGWKITRTGHVE